MNVGPAVAAAAYAYRRGAVLRRRTAAGPLGASRAPSTMPGAGAPAVFTDAAPGGAFGDADAEECPRPNSAALVMTRGDPPGKMRDGRGMPGETMNDAPGRAAARPPAARADGAGRRIMMRGLHARAGPAGAGGRRGRRRGSDYGRNMPRAPRPGLWGVRRLRGIPPWAARPTRRPSTCMAARTV